MTLTLHMGIIEDSIFAVYQKALEEGNLDQAEHAVDLIKLLKSKVDIHGFVDHTFNETPTPLLGSFFEPFPYRFSEEESVVVIGQSAILLTKTETRLFKLLSQNETRGTELKVITHNMIKNHMWGDKQITSNALRIAIKRIREKIEHKPEEPKFLINFYKQGYLFLGKQI